MESINVINNFFENRQLINALTDLPIIKKKFRSCPPWSQENLLHNSMDHEKDESNLSPENICCDVSFEETNMINDEEKVTLIFNTPKKLIEFNKENVLTNNNDYDFNENENSTIFKEQNNDIIENKMVEIDDSTQYNIQKEKLNNEIVVDSSCPTQLNEEDIQSLCFEILKGGDFLNSQEELEEVRTEIFAALKKRNKENHSNTIIQMNEKNVQDKNENELISNDSLQLDCTIEKEPLLPTNENIFCKKIIADEKISSNKQSISLESIAKIDGEAKFGLNEPKTPLTNDAEIKEKNDQLPLKEVEYFNCFEINQNELMNKENIEEKSEINNTNGEQIICEDQSAIKENEKHTSIMEEENYNLAVIAENSINENKRLNSVLIMNNEGLSDKLIRDEINSDLDSCSVDERENNSQSQKEMLYWKNLISKTLSNVEEKESYEKITISSEVQTEWSGSCKCSLAVLNSVDQKLDCLEMEKYFDINEKKRQSEYILEGNIKRKCLFQSNKNIQDDDDINNNHLEEPNPNGWFDWGTKVIRTRRVGLSKKARPNRLHSFHNN